MLFNECVQSGKLEYEVSKSSKDIYRQSILISDSFLNVFLQGDSDPQMHIRVIKKIKASSTGIVATKTWRFADVKKDF